MERHRCKLCSRRFSSGRALGGHMRSHLANLPLPPKTPQKNEGNEQGLGHGDYSTESISSLCSSEEEVEVVKEISSNEEKGVVYGLRENPKKSFRLVDPEFLDAGSVVQDRESETESTKKPTRRRSKRTRRAILVAKAVDFVEVKPSSAESLVELEQVSSVSDTSPEEDLALCLIMLSRDVWSTSDDSSEGLKLSQTKEKFHCEMCNKVFASSQALGSHRTIHKKFKKSKDDNEGESEQQQPRKIVIKNVGKKVHLCPFCGKVFGSGQALGGHKRSHFLSSSTTAAAVAAGSCSAKNGDSSLAECSNSASKSQEGLLMIDLNLPAPMEEEEEDDIEDFCQQEASAVSDADFINPIKALTTNNHSH